MTTPRILVDADACPVKDEIYRVAFRLNLPVVIVANARIRIPDHPLVSRMVVTDGFDAADDWIAGEAGPRTIIVTADILLADRCLKVGALVTGPNGKAFTSAMIGGAVATRAIMADLRAGMGEGIGGPPPFTARDRSTFLQTLDRLAMQLLRQKPSLRAAGEAIHSGTALIWFWAALDCFAALAMTWDEG